MDRERTLARALLLGAAAFTGCTLIADPGQFEVSPAVEGDCRTAGASAKCDGLVPSRCSSESGEWEAAGPACTGEAPRCLDGACVACLPPAQLLALAEQRLGSRG